nr:hypothetical protein [Aquicoccus sp. G2-2]MEA1113670.1 hypothetical protein [Aquicoccus sp. G2-2]
MQVVSASAAKTFIIFNPVFGENANTELMRDYTKTTSYQEERVFVRLDTAVVWAVAGMFLGSVAFAAIARSVPHCRHPK